MLESSEFSSEPITVCGIYQEREATINEDGKVQVHDFEMLDELITSRGELKVRTVSFSEDRHDQVKTFVLLPFSFIAF